MSMRVCWGTVWLLVVNLAAILNSYRKQFLQINLYINYILHYYYNLVNYVLSTLVLCLAQHLTRWPVILDNSFKPVETSCLDLFNHEVRCLWIFFFMMCVCVTHLKALCFKKWPFHLSRTYIFLFLFSFCLVTSCLCQWSSQGINLAFYWMYMASPTAVYVI